MFFFLKVVFLLGKETIYGFPLIQQNVEGKDRWLLKVGVHYASLDPSIQEALGGFESCDPNTVCREIRKEDVTPADNLMKQLFEGSCERVKSKVCLYNVSKDG